MGALVGMSAACAAMLVPIATSAPTNRFFIDASSAMPPSVIALIQIQFLPFGCNLLSTSHPKFVQFVISIPHS